MELLCELHAGLGVQAQRHQLGARTQSTAQAHGFHSAMYAALVDLLQFGRDLGYAFSLVEGEFFELGLGQRPVGETPLGGLLARDGVAGQH